MNNENPEYKEILRLREMLTITGNLDGLTQIGNRRYLDRHSEQLWQEHLEQSQPMSCLLINLDFFKYYSGVCASEGQIRWLKPLLSKVFSVLTRLNTAIQ